MPSRRGILVGYMAVHRHCEWFVYSKMSLAQQSSLQGIYHIRHVDDNGSTLYLQVQGTASGHCSVGLSRLDTASDKQQVSKLSLFHCQIAEAVYHC